MKDFDIISVSAGQHGLRRLLSQDDYLRASCATVADHTRATS